MEIKITSSDNKIFKALKSLAQKKYRDKTHEFVIEGKKPLLDAVMEQATIHMLIYRDGFDFSSLEGQIKTYMDKKHVKIYCMAAHLFDKICDTKQPQGILAVCEQAASPYYEMQPFSGYCVFCDDISDPGNLGTILRTAAAAGAQCVILSNYCVDLYHPKTVRSTMGSLFHIPVFYGDTEEVCSHLHKQGVQIFASSLDAPEFQAIHPVYPACLVVGNEAHGISETVKQFADAFIKIPMQNHVESLNAGVAAGILLYHFLNNRVE